MKQPQAAEKIAGEHRWKFHLLSFYHVTQELRERSEVRGQPGPDTLLRSGSPGLSLPAVYICPACHGEARHSLSHSPV